MITKFYYIVIALGMVTVLLSPLYCELKANESILKARLGKMIQLNGKWVTVIDYDVLRNKLILSNCEYITPQTLDSLTND